MRRTQIYFIIILLAAIMVLIGFQYLISIYEVQITAIPDSLYADNKSECKIEAVPLNSLGMKALFRNASAKIEIREGKDLVEIIILDEKKGVIKLRAKDRPGIVVIFIKPEKALLPTSVEIKILPNVV